METTGGRSENSDNSYIVIDSKTRYSAAQTELNARLVIRTNINTAHIASVLAAIAAYIACRSKASGIVFPFYPIVSFVMPLISTFFVKLLFHNEQIIGLLGLYCAGLERLSNQCFVSITPPGWFSENKIWLGRALKAREDSDRATRALCAVSPIIVTLDIVYDFLIAAWDGGIAHFVTYEQWTRLFVLLLSGLIAAYNIHIVNKIRICRDHLAKSVYDPQSRTPLSV